MNAGWIQERRARPQRRRLALQVLIVFTTVGVFPLGIVGLTAQMAGACAGRQNVIGQDLNNVGNNVYGNRANILVNNIDYTTLNDSIFRSLLVVHVSPDESVEVGWTGHNGSHTNPTVYMYGINDGSPFGMWFADGLTKGNDYNIRVQDANADGVFSEYVGSTYEQQSPAMGWSKGYPTTNTERHNSCDTDYSHFYTLQICSTANPCGWQTYGNLDCKRNDTTTYKFSKISNGEHYVQAGNGECP